tara:strand:- start:602 stop:898 length:297 start_codon:yes stop_codon:yes gene_type:complete
MLKYNILHRINKMPYANAKLFKREAPKQLNCTSFTFSKWIYLKHDEKHEIRGGALIQIAEFFKVQPIELFTVAPTKLKIKQVTLNNNLQTSILDYDNN